MILSKHAASAFSNAAAASSHVAPRRGNGFFGAELHKPPLYLQTEQQTPRAVHKTKPAELPVTRRSLNAEDRHVFDIWAMRVAVFYFLAALICLVTGCLSSRPTVHPEASRLIELAPMQGAEP